MSQFKQYKQLSLSKTHKKVLAHWKSDHIFDKSITNRKGNSPFTFYEGGGCHALKLLLFHFNAIAFFLCIQINYHILN